MPNRYALPSAFKAALDDRISRDARQSGIGVQRLRQLRIFDRFLVRLFRQFGERLVVKGGIALELRLSRVRATADIDLRLSGSSNELLISLRQAGQIDLKDFFRFEVNENRRHPTIEGEGIRYEGQRFQVQAMLAGKKYGEPFGVDIAVGDPMTGSPESIQGSNFFLFADVEEPIPTFLVYPRSTHIAEKLHAFTLPRDRPNSRVKDLPDIALLATTGPFEGRELRAAIKQTFAFRNTHGVPLKLPEPPSGWEQQYAKMADENQLLWRSLEEVFVAAGAFVDPVLAGNEGSWDPALWSWMPKPGD
jgi:hypothetical protein